MGSNLYPNASAEIGTGQLWDAGRWPAALQAMRSTAATSLYPQHLPPQWYGNNKADGDRPDVYMPIPAAFLTRGGKQGQLQRNLAPIGPVDVSAKQGAALQEALAASLRGLGA